MIEFHPQEKPERIIRRYWLTLAPEIFVGTFFLWLPVGVLVLTSAPQFSFLIGFFPLILLGMLVYYAIFLGGLFYLWMDYYLDLLIITNQRLLMVEQRGFFDRQVSAIPLEKIQDITVRKKGILQHFFDFGDMQIQTAGEENYTMRDVAHPNETKNFVLHYSQRHEDTP